MARALTSKNMSGLPAGDLIEKLANFYELAGESAQAAIVRAFFN
jgi:hypothetical protein